MYIRGVLNLLNGIMKIKQFNIKKMEKGDWILLIIWCASIAFCTGALIGDKLAQKEYYIKALKGHNPYTMKIVYEKKDSIFVAVDTNYFKK
jgi:hypothetical protein